MSTQEQLDVEFLHPTESETRLEATVSADATPKFLIDALIAERFVPAPVNGGRYGLLNTANNKALLPNVSLGQAQVQSGSALKVTPEYSGASR